MSYHTRLGPFCPGGDRKLTASSRSAWYSKKSQASQGCLSLKKKKSNKFQHCHPPPISTGFLGTVNDLHFLSVQFPLVPRPLSPSTASLPTPQQLSALLSTLPAPLLRPSHPALWLPVTPPGTRGVAGRAQRLAGFAAWSWHWVWDLVVPSGGAAASASPQSALEALGHR